MADLERAVVRAAEAIDWPEADLREPIVARISTEQRHAPVRRWMRAALAAAALAILVVAIPAGRQAVADLLEVAGIRVSWGDETALPVSALDLGEQVTLVQAAERVPFPLLVPTDAVLDEPDAVFHTTIPPGGAVHLVWGSDDALPAAGDTGVGLLYSQFRLGGGIFIKSLSPQVEARSLAIRGNEGFWIAGAPHIIFYEDESGARERVRLAANVLAWEEDGVTHRIETTLGLEFALDLAESLESLD